MNSLQITILSLWAGDILAGHFIYTDHGQQSYSFQHVSSLPRHSVQRSTTRVKSYIKHYECKNYHYIFKDFNSFPYPLYRQEAENYFRRHSHYYPSHGGYYPEYRRLVTWLSDIIKIRDRIERRKMMRNRGRMKYSMTSSMSIVTMKQSESESTSRVRNDATTTTSASILDDNLDQITIVDPLNASAGRRTGQRDPDVIIRTKEDM